MPSSPFLRAFHDNATGLLTIPQRLVYKYGGNATLSRRISKIQKAGWLAAKMIGRQHVVAQTGVFSLSQTAPGEYLSLYDIVFQAGHKCDHFVTLLRGHFQDLHGVTGMTEKNVPITFADLHSGMGQLHIPPGVID